MIDIMALQEELADTQIRLKAMERAYFEKIVECDRLKEKMKGKSICSATAAPERLHTAYTMI